MKKSIIRISTRMLSVLLAVLLLAASVPFAFAEEDCPHSNMTHYAEGSMTDYHGHLCVEFWECNTCYRHFRDENAQQELTYSQVFSIDCPHSETYFTKGNPPLCGGYGTIDHWTCRACLGNFEDKEATKPLTSISITSDKQHDYDYNGEPLGFKDEGNGRPWLSTTTAFDNECLEEYGMSAAEKFSNDGNVALCCKNCGVFVRQSDGAEIRPSAFGFFVNPIDELAGAVKIPSSPEGLSNGEKWMDMGSLLSLSFTGIASQYNATMLEYTLYVISTLDYYFNEATQQLFGLSISLVTGKPSINDESDMNWIVRTVGDEATAKALPSSPDGLTPGHKWFDAVAFYQDAIAQYVPEDENDRTEIEQLFSIIAAAAFALSSDGNDVFTTGCNAEMKSLAETYLNEEEQAFFHNGNWFLSLNGLLNYEDITGINVIDYVKTVEGDCAHVWNDGFENSSATCTAVGAKTFTCTLCGATRDEIIPALGHDWDGGEVTQQPTITETGTRTYTCNRCGATKLMTIPKADPTSLVQELESKLNLKDIEDDVTVFFDPDANLPADTVFNYEILKKGKFYQFFDLTLSSNGKEVQPGTPVWVKQPIPKGWDPKFISVWHGDEELPSFTDGGYVYFITPHFSEFQVKYDDPNQDDPGAQDPQPDPNLCHWCGKVHNGFFQKIIGFFHNILAKIFGNKY